MELLRHVLVAYLDGGGGKDWRFCLQVVFILSEITMKNATKGNNNSDNSNNDNNDNDNNSNNNNNNNNNNLAVDNPQGGSSCPLFPGRLEFGILVFRREKNP